MKINLRKKLLFIIGLFICFLILNCKTSFASTAGYDSETEYALSPDYNTSWVESYLDLEMNPADGVKKLIDSQQDYFNFTSSDLWSYWFLTKYDYIDSEDSSSKYFYVFCFSQTKMNPYYANSYPSDDTYVYYVTGSPVDFYCITFDENGFYGSTDLVTYSNIDNRRYSLVL